MNKKRIYAYIIDYLIAGLLLSALISMPFYKISDKQQEKLVENPGKMIKAAQEYSAAINKKDEKAIEETKAKYDKYTKEMNELSFTIEKQNIVSKVMVILLLIVYYGIIPYFNNSQTLGKKFMKIKMVSKDNKEVGIGIHLVRALILYGILKPIIMAALLPFYNINNVASYFNIITYENLIFLAFLIVEVVLLFTRNGISLTDNIFGIKFISEDEMLI